MSPVDLDNKLPAVSEPRPAQLPVPYTWWDLGASEPGVPLSHYLFIIRRRLWRMLAFVLGCVAAVFIVCSRLTPIYESVATIDIDLRTPTGIVGQEAFQPFGNDADQFLATQVKMIQSDSVLRPVVLRHRLFERGEEFQGGWLSDKKFDPDAPIRLENLEVERPPNTYLLEIRYRSRDRQLAADVANSIAQSYLEHTYNIRYRAAAGLSRFMERQLEELRAKMEQSSGALARYEKELNIINPEERTNILSARLLELNSEFTKAQADRVLKEAAYRSLEAGSLEAALASAQGDELQKLIEELNAARQRFAEIKAHFGPNHPEFAVAAAELEELERLRREAVTQIRRQVEIDFHKALDRERMLETALRQSKAEFDSLNARSFEYQALKREAESDKRLYEELLRKIKEATINASFQNSSARIADPARPGRKPVFPNIPVSLLLTLLLSGALAVAAAVVADRLDNSIRDPEQVAQTMNADVVGTLPLVKSWKGSLGPALAGANGVQPARKADDPSVSGFREAIRTLRNSILLADFDRRLRSLLITSASPGEGKSTTALHLAIAHAEQHHRTLLIDGDLRRPSVHKRFDASPTVGLSTVLLSEVPWRQALIKPEHLPSLDVLPAGPASHRAADLFGAGLVKLLEEAALEYDLIILDAPPLLGFAEPLRMATAVDGVVVVTRAGETSRKAVQSVVQTLRRLRAHLVGIVLNEVHKQISDSYYYYGYYRKYYRDNGLSSHRR